MEDIEFKNLLELGGQARARRRGWFPVLDLEKRIREWSVPEFEDRVGFQALGVDCSKEVIAGGGGGPSQGGTDTTIRTDIPQPSAAEIEELAHYRQDLHHCAEAWRYVLLLYVEKVFKWRHNRDNNNNNNGRSSTSANTQTTKPKTQQALMLSFLARKTLNNVCACRRTSTASSSNNTSTSSNRNTNTNNLMLQKQLLLPVFLAGCETSDEAREYCSWWSEETGYDMFLTAAALLEEVWGCASRDEGSWWGGVIDGKTKTKGGCAAGGGGFDTGG